LLSDGEIGHCHADFQAEEGAALLLAAKVNSDRSLASVQTFQKVVDAYFPRLVCTRGGIAGESLELGRPIYSTPATPVAMNGRDELFGVVHTEGVHLRSVCFPKTGATKVQGQVLVDRPVSIAELERTLQDTDGVVVSLLSPAMPVCDAHQTRVTNL
jgi:hypothetical protein